MKWCQSSDLNDSSGNANAKGSAGPGVTKTLLVCGPWGGGEARARRPGAGARLPPAGAPRARLARRGSHAPPRGATSAVLGRRADGGDADHGAHPPAEPVTHRDVEEARDRGAGLAEDADALHPRAREPCPRVFDGELEAPREDV